MEVRAILTTSLNLRETRSEGSTGVGDHWYWRSTDHNTGDVHHALVKVKFFYRCMYFKYNVAEPNLTVMLRL